jgi:hypothetical protein
MNEQNNNITLMSDIDPSLYTNLKAKQQAFIRCIAESIGSMTTVEFSRKDLKEIANDHGIAWAPAWIVKDKNRVVKRGLYSVPELAAYRNLAAHPKDVVAECCEDVVGDAVDVLKDTTLGRAMTA